MQVDSYYVARTILQNHRNHPAYSQAHFIDDLRLLPERSFPEELFFNKKIGKQIDGDWLCDSLG